MKGRIGVLAGGDSPERAVSLLSGHGVFDALKQRGHPVHLIEIENLDDLVRRLTDIDVVFNCLHGGSGEDGTVRLLLDIMGIRCVGSGALACARAMDKVQAKAFFRAAAIPTPDSVCADELSFEAGVQEAMGQLSFPLIIKPQCGGSTIAVQLAEDESTLRSAAQSTLTRFSQILIEAFVPGRELTVGILRVNGEEIPLPVIEIRAPEVLFDYESKYEVGRAEFLAPAPLTECVARRVQSVALSAHRSLGCSGFSRVDVRLHDNGTPYVLEVNALPGMTPLSDLPRAAAVQGILYDNLVEIMLATATRG